MQENLGILMKKLFTSLVDLLQLNFNFRRSLKDKHQNFQTS